MSIPQAWGEPVPESTVSVTPLNTPRDEAEQNEELKKEYDVEQHG